MGKKGTWIKENRSTNVYIHYATNKKYVRIDFGLTQKWYLEVDPSKINPHKLSSKEEPQSTDEVKEGMELVKSLYLRELFDASVRWWNVEKWLKGGDFIITTNKETGEPKFKCFVPTICDSCGMKMCLNCQGELGVVKESELDASRAAVDGKEQGPYCNEYVDTKKCPECDEIIPKKRGVCPTCATPIGKDTPSPDTDTGKELLKELEYYLDWRLKEIAEFLESEDIDEHNRERWNGKKTVFCEIIGKIKGLKKDTDSEPEGEEWEFKRNAGDEALEKGLRDFKETEEPHLASKSVQEKKSYSIYVGDVQQKWGTSSITAQNIIREAGIAPSDQFILEALDKHNGSAIKEYTPDQLVDLKEEDRKFFRIIPGGGGYSSSKTDNGGDGG